MTTKVTVGDTYKNKHNGRIIKVIERTITDSGTVLYKVLDTDDQTTDYIGDFKFDTHWAIRQNYRQYITTGRDSGSISTVRMDVEFVVDTFSRDDLITYIENLRDACDTHSQTIITSDGED